MSKEHLGELEELILLVILKLEKDAYGLAIRQEIIKQAQRSVTIGAVHGTVNRLEDKGLIESEYGGATEERGGRRKRILTVTAAGLKALERSKDVKMNLWQQIPVLVVNKS
ncbi:MULTISPECIES: PadR family transcriptional regulator [unclassified Imperialibacter]|uniref:PadR family transcriptional regulator n=1 Tax=unclassified Imperialibacter TaxID=2629706 RepID=UPI001253D8AC|nr:MULTISPECIES: helix-turn-helix transcriptional regulator [unclassified Imperialibacter]CAD5278256.1 PadR family transcriptional regulator [Imperialibacter sp. 75]CAD5295995.1 PadR family transcriptional regulator [Imperialibacter sp. 89]VVT11589.1 PadR family transcriptional regulator [Imperialibacter sp. EC-SDR9]